MTDQPRDLFGEFSGLPRFIDPFERYRGYRMVLMENDQGQRVLNDVLEMARIGNYTNPSPQRPMDPLELAFRDGQRSIGIQIIQALTRQPVERPAEATRKRPDAA